MKTSVIIPIYNTKSFLRTCIESVLAQTQKDIEIILVDDGSTDGSTQIIKEYEARYPFIKAIYQENQKQGAARNAGVKVASGEYIYFLDSDDYIEPDLLEQCYQIAQRRSLDLVMFDAQTFVEGEEGKLKDIALERKYDRSKVGIKDQVYPGIGFWNAYYPKDGIFFSACLLYTDADFLRSNALLFEPGIYYEDNDWLLRVFLCAERVSYIPVRPYHRRIREGSTVTIPHDDDHFKSCIVECRKILLILLDDQSGVRRDIIYPVLMTAILRFDEIFKLYFEEDRLGDVWKETKEFYIYLLMTYKHIVDKELRFKLIDEAKGIKEIFNKFADPVDIPVDDLEEYKRQVLFDEFQKYPLQKEGAVVGIYGIGKKCSDFFSLYRKVVGEPLAEVFFIDSYQASGGTYCGYPLYNLYDSKKLHIDHIIVASTRYKDEMLENVRFHLEKEIKILFIPDILKYVNDVI